jgi:pilus assembly protein Flp/PilA
VNEIFGKEEIMAGRLQAFLANETGATAIEYALVASLVAVGIIASINGVSAKIQATFKEIADNLK